MLLTPTRLFPSDFYYVFACYFKIIYEFLRFFSDFSPQINVTRNNVKKIDIFHLKRWKSSGNVSDNCVLKQEKLDIFIWLPQKRKKKVGKSFCSNQISCSHSRTAEQRLGTTCLGLVWHNGVEHSSQETCYLSVTEFSQFFLKEQNAWKGIMWESDSYLKTSLGILI